MSGLSGLSNHCRERSFLIWAVVGFFALAIGVSSGDQWTRCVAWAEWLATSTTVVSGELSGRNLLASRHREPGNGCAMSEAPQRTAEDFWPDWDWRPARIFDSCWLNGRLPQARHWVGQ